MTRSVYSIIFLALLAESYVLPSAPESTIVQRNEIPSLLYHATCADVLEAIRQGSANGRLDLMPARKWPDEYSWSGKCSRQPRISIMLTQCTTYARGLLEPLAPSTGRRDARLEVAS
jgi:hypothetical protein